MVISKNAHSRVSQLSNILRNLIRVHLTNDKIMTMISLLLYANSTFIQEFDFLL